MAFRRKSKKTDEAASEPAALPTIALVLEPGPVKHIHFDARGLPIEAPAAEPAPTPAAEPAPEHSWEPLPEATPEPEPVELAGRRRKLYETDRGNQVVAYETGETRQFATTSPYGERPFDPARDVDPLQASEPKPESDHIYHEVIPVSPKAPVHPVMHEEAWEPGGQTARRPPRPAPLQEEVVRKPKAARKPKRRVVRRKAPKKRAKRGPHTDFPGDDHLVIDIEGIGPVYAKRLQKQGVYTTSRLAFEKPGNLAKRIRVPRKTVKQWRNMAELIKAKGIGKQYAEVLVRSGVKGIDDLKTRKPEKLAKVVNKFLRSVDSTVIKTGVHEKRAKSWIKVAKTMRRRVLPVPRKGPPQVETVKGFIEKLPKYGETKKAKAKRVSKARKAAKRPARKASRKVSRKGGRKKR